MKNIARQVVWWPGIDSDLTKKVQFCEVCQVNQKSPEEAPLNPWEWPKRPWSRIHIDHLGPMEGKMILYTCCDRCPFSVNGFKQYLFPQPHQYLF